MALTISEKVASILFHRSGDIADHVTKNIALLRRLKSRGRIKLVGGGYELREDVAYQENSTFQWYDEWEQLNVDPSAHLTAAQFDWKQCSVAVLISGKEKRMNSGKEQLIDLVDSRIENAENTMLNNLSTGVYSDGTGSDSKQIDGLAIAVADSPSTGTYAGIDRSTYSWWRNISYDSTTDGGGACTSTNINAQLTALWVQLVRGNDQPDLCVANNLGWQTYHASLTAIQRLTDENTDVAKSGFPSLKFMGSDYVLDGGFGDETAGAGSVTAGADTVERVYMLNTKYLRLQVHRACNMVPLDPATRAPINQDGVVKLIGWMGNLTCSAPFLQGVLKD